VGSPLHPDQPATEDPSEQAGQPASEARREALKTFGRYAAAAPTAMLLLGPRLGHTQELTATRPPPTRRPPPDGGYR
jgi:hypothetical protein